MRRASFLAAAVLLIGACSGGGGAQQNADTAFVGGDGKVVTVPADQRQDPVTITGTGLDGARLDLAALRGEPVVLNVWGSWCAPCRQEAKDVQAAFTELEPDGVSFVGINNGRDSAPAAQSYEKTYGITYPSILDKDGSALLALRGAVPPSAVPTTLVLDAAGRVAARVSGPVDRSTLVQMVRDVQQ